MNEKNKKDSKIIQYCAFFSLAMLFSCLILVAINYGMRIESYICFSDTSINTYLLYHVAILEFLVSNSHFILTGIIVLIILFEYKYKYKYKNITRLMTLSFVILLLNVFTISFLFGIVHLMYTAICSPNIQQVMREHFVNEQGSEQDSETGQMP